MEGKCYLSIVKAITPLKDKNSGKDFLWERLVVTLEDGSPDGEKYFFNVKMTPEQKRILACVPSVTI